MIPGVTVAGIAGIVALVAGLGMTLVGAGATASAVITALARVALSILLAMAGAFALFRVLPRLPFGRRLVLDTGMDVERGYVSAPAATTAGRDEPGRPSRRCDRAASPTSTGPVDVVSEGGFVEVGTSVDVIRVDGNRIVVRPVLPRQEPPHD